MRIGLLSGVLSLALVVAGCSTLTDPLPRPVHAALSAADLPAEALAVVAFPVHRPNTGLRWQADQVMQPGSTIKVLTSAVALDELGPQWRGRTDLLASGTLVDGVLHGPLVLRGAADADLDWGVLWNLLRQAREAGVREVRGGLWVDRSRFEPAREDQVPPFDEAPEFPYNVSPDALHLNGNLLDLHLQADEQSLTARWSPAWAGLTVDSRQVALVDAPCNAWNAHWRPPIVSPQADGLQVLLQGAFPRGCTVRQALNLVDRDWLDPQALLQLWRQLGGKAEQAGLGGTPAEARVLASHQARPLAELLRGAIKRSDNALTRLVYLELGATAPTPGAGRSTRERAAARVEAWLKRHGIDTRSLVLDNGSGLSRSERLSPTLLAQVISTALAGRHAPDWLAGLPLVGVDGTMGRRLRGTAAEGRARLKTGTLNNVVGLAGVVSDARDRPWVVVALLNHPQAAAKGRPVLDALIALLATQGGASENLQ
ncbi:MAG: D-alanyl-D-alanine carboxypeptidase/D-alanyl-D-alanine-endopeptidase [Inhella sp.]|uniref:D-alanyl-D-alanine carboxypeptidase/D-alanyl-D-alanine endopeptidase n=1 Tax=Inhella sp. TaxID=1921806 RepID=UPI00391BB6BC